MSIADAPAGKSEGIEEKQASFGTFAPRSTKSVLRCYGSTRCRCGELPFPPMFGNAAIVSVTSSGAACISSRGVWLQLIALQSRDMPSASCLTFATEAVDVLRSALQSMPSQEMDAEAVSGFASGVGHTSKVCSRCSAACAAVFFGPVDHLDSVRHMFAACLRMFAARLRHVCAA